MAIPAVGTRQSRSRPWAGYVAAAWAFVFSLQSFYYAVGGTVGADTFPPSLVEPLLARERTAVALMWATGMLKVIAGVLALALVRQWGRKVPRPLLLAAGWGAVAIMGVYEGAASWVQHALMVAGVIAIPAGLGRRSAYWHLVFWDPWWLIGGLLFGLATRQMIRRRSSHPCA